MFFGCLWKCVIGRTLLQWCAGSLICYVSSVKEPCNIMYHTATHCNTLQHTATLCNTLQHSAAHWSTPVHYYRAAVHRLPNLLGLLCKRALQHTATLQRTEAHCNTLQYTATHCNTIKHTAAHCNTLQHTAAHCNTLQHTTALIQGYRSQAP